MFDGKRTTKSGHGIQLVAHSHIQGHRGCPETHLFDVIIDGQITRGKAFRRWASRRASNDRIKGCRLDFQFRMLEPWKGHPHRQEITHVIQSILLGEALFRDRFPEHPLNGHYVCHGTDELNQKYAKNKPKGPIRIDIAQ